MTHPARPLISNYFTVILIFRIGNVTDERSGTGEVDTDGDVVPPVRFACQGDGVEMEIRVVARRSVGKGRQHPSQPTIFWLLKLFSPLFYLRDGLHAAMATGNWHLRDEMPTMVPCIQRQPRRRRARPSSRSSIHEEADSQRREQTVIHVDADNEMVGDEVPPYKEVRREGGLHPLGSTL
ncbi:Os08g0216200 [Oryza sativa Japonica Group]|uniref:Os08g0214200 protein n=1 Tax=Oryza sativa subsp. japonica TaxID=39947 RepID=A0A0N7KPG3_ORYSJ|nr:Os08g0214200 [Oryza sativa Japonica Group]BAT04349.1 Os08g0216200 [Oryza sativa Japonica Group]